MTADPDTPTARALRHLAAQAAQPINLLPAGRAFGAAVSRAESAIWSTLGGSRGCGGMSLSETPIANDHPTPRIIIARATRSHWQCRALPVLEPLGDLALSGQDRRTPLVMPAC